MSEITENQHEELYQRIKNQVRMLNSIYEYLIYGDEENIEHALTTLVPLTFFDYHRTEVIASIEAIAETKGYVLNQDSMTNNKHFAFVKVKA